MAEESNLKSILIRMDSSEGDWRKPEEVIEMIQTFLEDEDSVEFSNEYQAKIRTMDEGNERFFATYKPDSVFNKRNLNVKLYKEIVPNIQTALQKYPNVLDHAVFNQL